MKVGLIIKDNGKYYDTKIAVRAKSIQSASQKLDKYISSNPETFNACDLTPIRAM